MNSQTIKSQIRFEISIAMARLGAGNDFLSRVPSLSVRHIYAELKSLGAVPTLLGIVGSWGDTLPNNEILEALHDWNQNSDTRVRHTTSPNCNFEMVLVFGMDTIMTSRRECSNCKKEFLIVKDVPMRVPR